MTYAWWMYLVLLVLGWSFFAWSNERKGVLYQDFETRAVIRAVIGTLAVGTIALLLGVGLHRIRPAVFFWGGLGVLLFFNLVLPWVYLVAYFKRRPRP